MIWVDIDQIYGFTSLFVSNISEFNKVDTLFIKELLFPISTPFIPKEIYNIISIEGISFFGTPKKLIIDNRIINLHNINRFCVQDAPNIIISRHILRLALLDVFYCGSNAIGYKRALRNNKERYKRIITENTTIFY